MKNKKNKKTPCTIYGLQQ